MGVEANTGPSDRTIEKLDSTWPSGVEQRSQGDDHLRFIKAVLKTIFPGASGNGFNTPITATEAELNQLHGVALATKLATPKVDTSQGADIASAATIDLDAATGQYVTVTGSTTIAGITLSQGHIRLVRFASALQLTNSASLVLPNALNITVAAGDLLIFVGEAAGVVRCLTVAQLSKLVAPKVDTSQGADIASAATIDLDAATGQYVNVTGTTTITGITLSRGHFRIVKFTGALQLTNSASLVLPTGDSVKLAANDMAIFIGEAAGVVRCVYISSKNTAAFSAYKSGSTQAGSVTPVKVTFQSEEFDTTGEFDSTANHRFLPAKPGYYNITAALAFSMASSSDSYLYMYKNGALFCQLDLSHSNTSGQLNGSRLVPLNGTTDYVEIFSAMNGSSPVIDLGLDRTYFQGYYVRPL